MSIDLIAMFGNLSSSLASVQKLLGGMAYLLGIWFIITALIKFKKIGETKSSSSSEEKMNTPLMYLLGGGALLFLPTSLQVVSNTLFGNSNVLQYIEYAPYNIFGSMAIIVKTAGLIWFVRGCVLIVGSSQPGGKEGAKGLAFLCAGILAMNFALTYGVLLYFLNGLISFTMTIVGK
jgi:hypothetical protein